MHYAYDGAGRPVGISDPFGDTTRFVYDAAGRRVQKLGTQGLRTDYRYAPGTGWLTGITSSTPSGVAADFSYPSHDDVGKRLAMTETSGGTTAYTYDALDHRVLRGLVVVPSGDYEVFLRHADVAPLAGG